MMHRDIPAVREAVDAGVCRHCGGARTPEDAKGICIECGRCIGCKCSPTCATRKPVEVVSDQEQSIAPPSRVARRS